MDFLVSAERSIGVSKATLLLIDMQNDFHAGGSIAVPGAESDCLRIAEMIEANFHHIEDIFVTLDTHYPEHIAHSRFWNNRANGLGDAPAPYTLITHDDVVSGRWYPVARENQQYCEDYTYALEEKGRFHLTIWPDHCIINTHGNKIVERLQVALDAWSAANNGKAVHAIQKGQNNLTEMYSAIEAEVPDLSDPRTLPNMEFVDQLRRATKVIIGGQALSHCVNYTTRDLLRYWGRDPADLILLLDGSSPILSSTEDAEIFVNDMREANVTLRCTTDVFCP